MNKSDAKVGIVMGSESDHEVMKIARDTLEQFGVSVEYRVASAHRSPELAGKFASTARERGLKVIIAAAGGAAHLAGAMAANTTLPVIGVPLDSSPLQGLDALLSTAQMPGGVPVATVSIGKWGAKNAAILAVQILATSDETLQRKLDDYKAQQQDKIEKTVLD